MQKRKSAGSSRVVTKEQNPFEKAQNKSNIKVHYTPLCKKLIKIRERFLLIAKLVVL